MLDLFFKYEWHNFLHNLVKNLLEIVITGEVLACCAACLMLLRYGCCCVCARIVMCVPALAATAAGVATRCITVCISLHLYASLRVGSCGARMPRSAPTSERACLRTH